MITLTLRSGLLLATFTRGEPVPEDDGYVTVYATPPVDDPCECETFGLRSSLEKYACGQYKGGVLHDGSCDECGHSEDCHP